MNRETIQRGVNTLAPPQSAPEELADRAAGLTIANYPQQSGEDDLDYTIRVTRLARDAISQRSPPAAAILLSRLVQLEDTKLHRTVEVDRVKRLESDNSASQDCAEGREACSRGWELGCRAYKQDLLRRGQACPGVTDVPNN
jgi:hypothetical protein